MQDVTVQDEGWGPAIVGLLTWRVWRPGSSSIIARLRAVWILFVVAVILIVVIAAVVGDGVVLQRWVVYTGWGLCAVSVVITLYFQYRLKAVVVAAPADRIGKAFWGQWFLAAAMALLPVLAASQAVMATFSGEGTASYAVYWASLVSLPLLALLCPTVRMLSKLDQDRVAVDGGERHSRSSRSNHKDRSATPAVVNVLQIEVL